MKKTGLLIVGLLLVFAASSSNAAELIVDGGFESGSPNVAWFESSTNFGSPLCTIAGCGTGTGTGPHAGNWWAWFGGIGAAETGIVSQPIVIAPGTATLSFWFENIISDSPSDFIEARVDGAPVWVYFGFGALDGVLGYTKITVNIDAFADGGAHTIEFFSSIFGINGTGSNFFVDDVSVVDTSPEPPDPGGDNDECAGAVVVGLNTFTPFDTVGADPDPLLLGNSCGTFLGDGTWPGLWFEITGTGNQMGASTCGIANYDTKIGVFCADCGDLNCIDGNDDGGGCPGFTSEVLWDSQAGATYLIYVTGFSGASGQGDLFVGETGGPNVGTPFSCIPEGACCTDLDCAIVTEADCLAAGGVYLGDDTGCSSATGGTSDYVDTPGTPIPDSGGGSISEVIVVPADFLIADLDVDFVTDHTWTGDLDISLEGPDGTVIDLAAGSDDICGGESTADVIFDDDGPGFDCPGIGAPATGVGPPASPLAGFNGKSSAGTWTLTVTDTVGGDTGSLLQWSLHFAEGANACELTGACCDNGPGVETDCVTAQTQFQCETEGGLYLGNDSECTPDVNCYELLVTFESLRAEQVDNGVLISWTTLTEVDSAGFRVLRETIDGSKAVVAVSPLIHSAGNGLEGASYQFLDDSRLAATAERYFIDEIDNNGKMTRFGPIEVERDQLMRIKGEGRAVPTSRAVR